LLEKVWHADSFSKRTRIPISAIGWMMGFSMVNLFLVEAILEYHSSTKLNILYQSSLISIF
jgi:hypothetical protein